MTPACPCRAFRAIREDPTPSPLRRSREHPQTAYQCEAQTHVSSRRWRPFSRVYPGTRMPCLGAPETTDYPEEAIEAVAESDSPPRLRHQPVARRGDVRPLQGGPASVDASWVTFFEDGNVRAEQSTAVRARDDEAPEQPKATATADPPPRRSPRPRRSPAAGPPKPRGAATGGEERGKRESARRTDEADPLPAKEAREPGSTGREGPAVRRPPPAPSRTWTPASPSPPPPASASVPVKLLFDNRTVINNHLAPRARRQGLVHPPHRLRRRQGAQGDAGDEHRLSRSSTASPTSSSPSTSTSASRSTCRSPTARASCSCPSIKAAETMDFAEFWQCLRDDGPQGARQQARGRRLPGHHRQPDQPRQHRHQPLRAAADVRPGRHHRRRLDGLPAGVPGRVRAHDRQAWRSRR